MLQARPEVAEGIYANFASVRDSPYDITIDFANVDFSVNMGALVARVSMSPMLAEQLSTALGQTLERYANRAIEEGVGDGFSDGPETGSDNGGEG
jgi:hypothetical protein